MLLCGAHHLSWCLGFITVTFYLLSFDSTVFGQEDAAVKNISHRQDLIFLRIKTLQEEIDKMNRQVYDLDNNVKNKVDELALEDRDIEKLYEGKVTELEKKHDADFKNLNAEWVKEYNGLVSRIQTLEDKCGIDAGAVATRQITATTRRPIGSARPTTGGRGPVVPAATVAYINQTRDGLTTKIKSLEDETTARLLNLEQVRVLMLENYNALWKKNFKIVKNTLAKMNQNAG